MSGDGMSRPRPLGEEPSVADETRSILLKIRASTQQAEDALAAHDGDTFLQAVRTIVITANDLVRGTLSPARERERSR